MLQAGKPGWVPGSDRKVSSPLLSEKLSRPPNLLYNEKCGLFPGSKSAGA